MIILNAIEKAAGVGLVRNKTAGEELSLITLDLLEGTGFLYESSLRGNDMPYRLKQPNTDKENDLIIILSYFDMDDFHLLRRLSRDITISCPNLELNNCL